MRSEEGDKSSMMLRWSRVRKKSTLRDTTISRAVASKRAVAKNERVFKAHLHLAVVGRQNASLWGFIVDRPSSTSTSELTRFKVDVFRPLALFSSIPHSPLRSFFFSNISILYSTFARLPFFYLAILLSRLSTCLLSTFFFYLPYSIFCGAISRKRKSDKMWECTFNFKIKIWELVC